MSEITDKVTAIVVDLLDVKAEAVTADANFRKDLGADSLDLVELIMEFENEFGGEISDDEAMKIETVGQAVTFINDRMVAS